MAWIVERVPGFAPAWRRHRDFWDGEEAGLCNDLSAFADYVARRVDAGEPAELRQIFYQVEHLMAGGDAQVQEAVATCLLESLVNLASWNRIERDFRAYLGPRSRAHCQAWDEVTGAVPPAPGGAR